MFSENFTPSSRPSVQPLTIPSTPHNVEQHVEAAIEHLEQAWSLSSDAERTANLAFAIEELRHMFRSRAARA